MTECQLEQRPEYGGCCCACRFRLRAFGHDTNKQFSWACIAFVFMEGEDIAYIGDFEHGMCELFTARRQADD